VGDGIVVISGNHEGHLGQVLASYYYNAITNLDTVSATELSCSLTRYLKKNCGKVSKFYSN
jgi:ribosomal protein L24